MQGVEQITHMGILWRFVTLLNLLLGNNKSPVPLASAKLTMAPQATVAKPLAMDGDGNGAPTGVAVSLTGRSLWAVDRWLLTMVASV